MNSTRKIQNMFGISWVDENGLLHSENDQPAHIDSNGTMSWWKHGVRCRDNGPSYIAHNGDMFWGTNDVYHRTDGPAVIRKKKPINSSKLEWWIDDNPYNFQDWCIELNKTEEEILLLKLEYGTDID